MGKGKSIQIWIPTDLHMKMKYISASLDISMKKLVNEAVRESIEKYLANTDPKQVEKFINGIKEVANVGTGADMPDADTGLRKQG